MFERWLLWEMTGTLNESSLMGKGEAAEKRVENLNRLREGEVAWEKMGFVKWKRGI